MDVVVRMLLSIQLLGDYFLFMGGIILLLNIQRKRNCTGISVKTQIILAMVFSIRYMDLAVSYSKTHGDSANLHITAIIMYNSIKIAHIFVIYWTVLIASIYFNSHDDRKFDTFRNKILVSTCVSIAVLLNYDLQPRNILRTFSFCLEAVATLPQTYLISKARCADTVLIYYIGFLSLYKLSHLINWAYTLNYMSHRIENIAFVAGIVQLIIYFKFFVSDVFLHKFNPKNNNQDDRLSRIKVLQSRNQFIPHNLNLNDC